MFWESVLVGHFWDLFVLTDSFANRPCLVLNQYSHFFCHNFSALIIYIYFTENQKKQKYKNTITVRNKYGRYIGRYAVYAIYNYCLYPHLFSIFMIVDQNLIRTSITLVTVFIPLVGLRGHCMACVDTDVGVDTTEMACGHWLSF